VQAGINATVILQNRGEFALILATLALAAGLDPRIQSFAGLYVLVMAVIGPIIASRSEKIGGVLLGTKKKKLASSKRESDRQRDPMRAEEIALVEAATAGLEPGENPATKEYVDRVVEQANSQSDQIDKSAKDDEY
jgi:CPA2 family monovalent cation:H+ antiporter-2